MNSAAPAGWPGGTAKIVGLAKGHGMAKRKGKTVGRIIKALIYLVLIGIVGVSIYAYLGDLTPEQSDVTKPVVLNAD